MSTPNKTQTAPSVIHLFLAGGWTPCGLSVYSEDWPKGELWADLPNLEAVTCLNCIASIEFPTRPALTTVPAFAGENASASPTNTNTNGEGGGRSAGHGGPPAGGAGDGSVCICGRQVDDTIYFVLTTKLNMLMAFPEERLSEDGKALIRTLAQVIEDYEKKRWPNSDSEPNAALDAEAEFTEPEHGYERGLYAALHLLEDSMLCGPGAPPPTAQQVYDYTKKHLLVAIQGRDVSGGPCPACVELAEGTGAGASDYPEALRTRSEEAWRSLELVLGFFGGDVARTRLWFESPNPMLGGIRPQEMLALGRGEKLLQFIQNRLAENELPGDPRRTP